MKKLLLISTCFVLSGCVTDGLSIAEFKKPLSWTVEDSDNIHQVNVEELRDWWKKFDDTTLNLLIEEALISSPDRLIAEAKIEEARGLRRSSFSYLLPQVGASASGGREDTGSQNVSYPDTFFDAGFDASFEIDVFGKNRKSYEASESALEAAQAQYHDVTLTLIAEVVRTYVDFKAAQKQLLIASKNLQSQEKTLKLISDLNQLGEAPQLDVERAENLVNVTRASLPEYRRQTENARLQLGVLVGQLPEDVDLSTSEEVVIPGGNIMPVLMSPTQVLALRPDVQAASANLASNTALAQSAGAEIFPAFSLGGFYGFADNALLNSVSPWNIAANTAVSLLDFGRIEGRIDAARAREKQAYEQYRKTILMAVSEVETALVDYAHISEQQVSLEKAYISAANAMKLSEVLYKEGEVSFLDVLDAQRSANNAESALTSGNAAQTESLVRLFKSLGVY